MTPNAQPMTFEEEQEKCAKLQDVQRALRKANRETGKRLEDFNRFWLTYLGIPEDSFLAEIVL